MFIVCKYFFECVVGVVDVDEYGVIVYGGVRECVSRWMLSISLRVVVDV